MNVSLTPQLEELVRSKVASGMYNSASEVVREALRLLEEHDRIRTMKLQTLRAELQESIDAIDRGEAVTFDPHDIIDRGMQRRKGKASDDLPN